MNTAVKDTALFGVVAVLLIGTGIIQGWNSALLILNMGLISAIMALGVNLQWGFAGLFNIGVMGFVALGGLATVLVSAEPVPEAWQAGGLRIFAGLALGALTIVAAVFAQKRLKGRTKTIVTLVILIGGFFLYRGVFDPGKEAVEAVNPADLAQLARGWSAGRWCGMGHW
jgi:branched-chain amino acid transport system permease protein